MAKLILTPFSPATRKAANVPFNTFFLLLKARNNNLFSPYCQVTLNDLFSSQLSQHQVEETARFTSGK